MELIADILLVTGTFGACFYCFVLGRRLKRFNSLEKGVGGAVAVLSAQVDDLEKTLNSAQNTASVSANTLAELTVRAEEIAHQLELHMAALHDVTVPKATIKIKPDAPKVEPMFVRRANSGEAR